jgi:hypothetical protein
MVQRKAEVVNVEEPMGRFTFAINSPPAEACLQLLTSGICSSTSLPGLRIKENKEVYEGEVTELTPEETESVGGGYGKVGFF